MFVIFDVIEGNPLVVKVSDDGKVLADRAVIVCKTGEAAIRALRMIFGDDEAWNLTRFSIQQPKQEFSPALDELCDRMKVSLFCDEVGTVRTKAEVLEWLRSET